MKTGENEPFRFSPLKIFERHIKWIKLLIDEHQAKARPQAKTGCQYWNSE